MVPLQPREVLVLVILRTSPSSLYTCRVFITVDYMQPNLRNRGPGVQPGDLFTPSRNRHQYTRSSLVLEFAVIVNGYSPRL